jgi:hypothetical protein
MTLWHHDPVQTWPLCPFLDLEGTWLACPNYPPPPGLLLSQREARTVSQDLERHSVPFGPRGRSGTWDPEGYRWLRSRENLLNLLIYWAHYEPVSMYVNPFSRALSLSLSLSHTYTLSMCIYIDTYACALHTIHIHLGVKKLAKVTQLVSVPGRTHTQTV